MSSKNKRVSKRSQRISGQPAQGRRLPTEECPSLPHPLFAPPSAVSTTEVGDTPNYLSEAETDKLLVLTAAGLAPRPMTEADVARVMDWASNVRAGQVLLQGLLAGQLIPAGVKADGELGFRTVVGTLAPKVHANLQAALRRIEKAEAGTKAQTRGNA